MASDIKVNNIKSYSGNSLTLGASGDTVSLASGASQTGFGRTGTVDWDTTPKTASFTADSGDGYFVNTTSGAITVTLPAGTANAIVSLADYAATWQTNNVTVTPDGTDKIGGANADAILNTEGQSVTFVFVDSTQGWVNTMDSTSNIRGSAFVAATGGTITTSGDFKIHTFTSSGTFTVTDAGGATGSNTVDYLVVAGGAGGGLASGGAGGGGAGAGGYRESFPNPATGGLSVSAQAYPITIGSGGAGSSSTPRGSNGNPSTFSSITSAGGGGGGSAGGTLTGGPGGSGGGAAVHGGGAGTQSGGTGNTPSVSPPQGNPGGSTNPGAPWPGGSGGGASAAGGSNTAGGDGTTSTINASPVTRAGGGGKGFTSLGGAAVPAATAGGAGGGGAGGGPSSTGVAGTANTGGGAGGGGHPGNGGAGGSGIVIIRYKFQ